MLHVAPVGEEALLLGVGAMAAGGDFADAERGEAAARQGRKVAHPPALLRRNEGGMRTAVGGKECGAYFFAHLEMARADGGSQPGLQEDVPPCACAPRPHAG